MAARRRMVRRRGISSDLVISGWPTAAEAPASPGWVGLCPRRSPYSTRIRKSTLRAQFGKEEQTDRGA